MDIGATHWAINGRFLSQHVTGVQRYAREIIRSMDELLCEDGEYRQRLGFEIVAPSDAERPDALKQIRVHSTSLGTGHIWEQLILPLYQRRFVLSLGNLGPLAARPQVVCIHDANVFTEPDSYSNSFRLAYRTILPLLGRRAAKIATVSNFSAEMLVKYGICSREKIFIAPNGHEHALRWRADKSTLLSTLKEDQPFVLLLGSRARHKNIQVILSLADELAGAGIKLVVVGASSSIFTDEDRPSERPNISYTGYVTDDDLAALYGRALCLAFPSKTEGFGIPVLEAMVHGCPVISSNAASLPEVGGKAVRYCSPEHRHEWLSAILDLAADANLRSAMAELGRERVKLFSWKRSARTFLDELATIS